LKVSQSGKQAKVPAGVERDSKKSHI